MQPHEIRYISEVAKQQSILKASEVLYTSPSTLSKFIQKAENTYGVKFFDRVGKKFMLTYAGERYLYWLKEQEKLQLAMDAELSDIAQNKSGKLQIGIPVGYISSHFINHVVSRFHEAYPDIEVLLIEESSIALNHLITDNALDFAFSDVAVPNSCVHYQLIFKELVCIGIKKDHPVLSKAVAQPGFKYPWIPLSEIAQIPLIASRREQQMYSIVQSITRTSGIHFHTLTTASTATSVIDCVKADMGFAFIPETPIIINHLKDSIDLLSFGQTPLTREWMIYYHENHYLSEPLQYFMELIRNTYFMLLDM